MNRLFFVIVLAAMLSVGACGQAGNGPQEVAIVDLNEVAQATGQAEVIRARVEGRSAQLTDELRGLLANMESQLQTEKAEFDKNPAPENDQRMQQMTAMAQQQMGQAQAQANRQVTALENELAQEFRDKILPLARKEASNRGASIVLAKDAYVVWADDAIDLTAAVIAAWDNLPDAQKALGSDTTEDAAAAEPESMPQEMESPAAEQPPAEASPAAD